MNSTTDQAELNIDDFIKDNGLTVEFTPVPANPIMSSEMPKGSAHFLVILTKEGRTMQTYYSVGPGIVESWARASKKIVVGYHLRPQPWKLPTKSWDFQEYVKALAPKYRPEIMNVLGCLGNDCQSISQYVDFIEWAEDLGYDSDSIKAEETYRTCLKQSRELQRLLGGEQFQLLINNV